MENKHAWTKEKLLKNFDYSLFRFANLHSWYKLRPRAGLIINCTLIPVTGNIQEYKIGAFDPTEPINLYPDQVFWHFCDNEWCSPLNEKLEKIVMENQIPIRSMSDLYYSTIDLNMGQNLEDFFSENPYFMEYYEKTWHSFKPTYDRFRIMAELITQNILKDPEISLPQIQFAPSFMPRKDSDDEDNVEEAKEKHILSAQ